MEQLRKDLLELSTNLDSWDIIEKRHSTIENLPVTDDPELIALFIKNLSSSVENGQWTLDETIFVALSVCKTESVMEAIFLDLSFFVTDWRNEHLANIVNTMRLKEDDEWVHVAMGKSIELRSSFLKLLCSYPEVYDYVKNRVSC